MLVVDTYNVLGVWGVLPAEWAGLDVDGLGALIAGSRWAKEDCSLVCDGLSPAGEHRRADRGIGQVRSLYAGGKREADELIEDLISRSTAPRRLTVVSSDHRIRKAARKRRCRWLTSEAFLQMLLADASRSQRPGGKPGFTRQVPLKPGQVRDWLTHFGQGAADAQRIAEAAGLGAKRDFEPPASEPAPPQNAALPEPGGASEPVPNPTDDPILRAALEEWRGRLAPDDLDMERWLNQDPPSGSPKPPRSRR